MGAQPSSNGAAAAEAGDASNVADRSNAPKPAAGDRGDIRDDYERVGVSPPSPSQTPVATALGASGFLEILPPAVRSESTIDATSSPGPSSPGTTTPPPPPPPPPPNANRSAACVPANASGVDSAKAPTPPSSAPLDRQAAVIPASSAPPESERATTTTTTTTTTLFSHDASSAAVSTPSVPLPSACSSSPSPSPSPPPRLIRALYGTRTSTIDATAKLTRLLPWPIVLDRTVDPNVYFGADPQRGAPKSLWLFLSQDVRGISTRRVVTVLREHERRWDSNAVAEPELVQLSA